MGVIGKQELVQYNVPKVINWMGLRVGQAGSLQPIVNRLCEFSSELKEGRLRIGLQDEILPYI